jgi:hypothetical protein
MRSSAPCTLRARGVFPQPRGCCDAFGDIGTTFRALDWRTPIFSGGAVPIVPRAAPGKSMGGSCRAKASAIVSGAPACARAFWHHASSRSLLCGEYLSERAWRRTMAARPSYFGWPTRAAPPPPGCPRCPSLGLGPGCSHRARTRGHSLASWRRFSAVQTGAQLL